MSDLKRKYLHQPIANSYHPSTRRELSASSTHSTQQVLIAQRCWRLKIGRGHTIDVLILIFLKGPCTVSGGWLSRLGG